MQQALVYSLRKTRLRSRTSAGRERLMFGRVRNGKSSENASLARSGTIIRREAHPLRERFGPGRPFLAGDEVSWQIGSDA
jgi:hypothetical protein